MEKLTQTLWQASEDKKVCRLTLIKEPFPRVVHPYGICTTSSNHIVLVCKQTAGFTKGGGKAGFRNLRLDKIQEVEILEQKFSVDPNFAPSDGQYKEWVFHL